MSVLWQIEYEGELRPQRQWGIESIALTLYNAATDELRLTVAGEDADAAERFAFEGRVVLWRDGVRVFHGIVTQLPFSEKASGARQEYIVSGPWWWLENVVFGQERYVLADPRVPATGYAAQPVSTPRAIMYQGQDGAATTAGAQAQVAADYAATKAGLLYAGDAPFTRGTFDIPLLAPWEEINNSSCAEVIRRCLRWQRDAVAWWDYSGAKPSLQIARRADLDAVTLDLDEGSRVADYSVGSRPDLVPRGVTILFERTITVPDGQANAGSQYVAYEAQTAGPAVDRGVRNLISLLRLSGTGDGAEAVPSGLAAAYYNSLSALQWQGRVVLLEADPALDLAPGKVVNFSNGKTAWATMRALIQSVTLDLAARTTTIEYGPAEQLGPQDLLDQVRLQRGEGGGPGAQTRFDGTPDKPQPPRDDPPSVPPPSTPPSNPSGTFIQVCENGQERTVFVPSY